MTHIPHSTHDDEGRFISVITGLIKKGELASLPKWESSTKDEKAKLVRKKQADKEAAEAEALAKELGVHDEFFGSGKPGARKSKGKGKAKQQADGEEDDDTSALQALILKKRKNMDSFFDGLAAKYVDQEPAPKAGKKSKKRGKAADEEEEISASPKKKAKKDIPPPPDIDDAEFERIQRGLMDSKAKRSAEGGASTKPSTAKTRSAKGRKAR
ncbi:hypothetical protein BC628DRAFT_742249 [Trametes gibbosa]|nr:hypothetical protein BC628DRAFT_742249 [Trametes gibbosa]